MKLAAILIVIVLFMGYVFHCLVVEEQHDNEADQAWQKYSQVNHCHVIREDSATRPKALWQCDNFQVEH